MGLSSDLISQFVKATKDTKKTSSETTMWGTVVEYNNSKWVRLDGSDQLTPMSSTVSAEPGERVTILIKDHRATVTGNLSNPSASTSTVESVAADLVVGSARIDNLVSENVVIKDTLTANKASIEQLEAQDVVIDGILTAANAEIENLHATKLNADTASITYATIANLDATNASIYNLQSVYGDFEVLTTKNFEAVNGVIDNLQANKLDAETARITYATITDLNAAKADISLLNADVADIETLIFGSASGGSIQASFANAVIAQLGNAQIKSAMIENVTADKIVSGDIITNNVRVLSEDGKLLISDETIQISDNTRVRVQIGKDAAGDYSINIWDADGNLMFSEGGITDNAIKEAIIRNDMVSDTANISAHKLDINSLFKVINEDGSNTIISSKIYLNDKKQTLDVAFQQMTTTVNQNGTALSEAQSNLAKAQADLIAVTNRTDATEEEISAAKLAVKEAQDAADAAQATANQNSSDISALTQTVSTQGTQLSVVQGQISSKVWQQDITSAVNGISNEMNTKYSSLEQTVNGINSTVANHTSELINKADNSTVINVQNQVSNLQQTVEGFKTTVSETYVTKNEFDNLEIGGRNLAEKTYSHWTDTNVSQWSGGIGYRVNGVDKWATLTGFDELGLKVGDSYTISIDLNAIHKSIKLRIDLYRNSTLGENYVGRNSEVVTVGTNRRVSYSGVVEEEFPYFAIYVGNHDTTDTTTTTEQYKCLKIEKGNVATDWTPAPEDIEKRVSATETKIEQNSTSIELVATRTAANESVIASLQLAADGLTSRVSSNEGNIATALTNAAIAQADIDDLEIGGRNLFSGYSEDEIELGDYQSVGSFTQFMNKLTFNPCETVGEVYTISFWAKSPNGSTDLLLYNSNNNPRHFNFYTILTNSLGSEWQYFTHTVTNTDRGSSYTDTCCNRIEIYASGQLGVLVKKIKVEKGNKATDWTPAPEDMATENDIEYVNSEINNTNSRITAAESLIEQLDNCIRALVTDENGQSLMSQTSTGWTFSTSSINDMMSSLSNSIASLQSTTGSTQATVNSLQNAVNDLEDTAQYVRIASYENEPCIELGKSSSEFKLKITNTRIMFMRGSSVPTYIDTTGLITENITINGELHHGKYVWKQRSNGNYGVQYVG